MSWAPTSELFINPYNFVSIKNQACERKPFKKGDLTGVIKCSLITKTPIIIPNSSNNNALNQEVLNKDEKNVARSYNFFSYDDLSKGDKDTEGYYEPVIPGSEIRGVIRSAFEAVTNSCISTIDVDRTLHQRSTRVKQHAGRLVKEDEKWMIQEADLYMVKSGNCNRDPMKKINKYDYIEGERVYITVSNDKHKSNMPKKVTRIEKETFDGAMKENAYIHIGEDTYKKHHERVFVVKNTPLIPVAEEVVNNFHKLLKLYKDDKLNKSLIKTPEGVAKHTGYKNVKVEEGALVYYDVDVENNVAYLSPAPITREVFNRKVVDILGDFAPCEKKKKSKDGEDLRCDGCRLFGMISTDNSGSSLGSRIRFSDARVFKKFDDNKKYYLGDKVINELSSPKISSTEFYMEKPARIECDIWNYDYAIKWIPKENIPKPIQIFKAYARGRKFYWYHEPKLDSEPELNERNCKVRILDKKNEFKFDIYFENITREELEKLVWTLSIGDKKHNYHYHKIGMGKPLGFGSFKIEVDEILERKVIVENETIKYTLENINVSCREVEKNKYIKIKGINVKEFLILTDSYATNCVKVCYPIGDNSSKEKNATAGYQWFIGNRFNDNENGNAMKPKIRYPLPEIKKPALTLHKFQKFYSK